MPSRDREERAAPRRRAREEYADEDSYYEEERPRRRRRKFSILGFFGLSSSMVVLVLIVVLTCLGLAVLSGLTDFIGDPLNNALEIFGFDKNAEPKEVDSKVIILGIREMSVLQTASGDLEIEKEVVDTGAAPDAHLTMRYVGSVNVGIDMSLINDQSVVVNPDNSLIVTLPPIQILDCALRQPDVISKECTGIPLVQDCGDIYEKLQDKAYDRSMEELLRRAQENEIVTTSGQPLYEVAYNNAETTIYNFLQTLGFTQVQFQRSTEQLPPSSTCYP